MGLEITTFCRVEASSHQPQDPFQAGAPLTASAFHTLQRQLGFASISSGCRCVEANLLGLSDAADGRSVPCLN